MPNLQKNLINNFWKYFKLVASIPHTSGNEKQLSDILKDKLLKYTNNVYQDKNHCLIAHIKATKGHEKLPMLTLQAHLDMVPAKSPISKHNFNKDPIQLIFKKEWVCAKDTSLGGDDAIGISCIMAISSTKEIKHGPIEIIFTTQEETTTIGAIQLDESQIQGKYLINVDSESDNYITIGSAGLSELWTETTLKYGKTPSNKEYAGLKLEINGVIGGHSGIDIHLPRIHIIRTLNEILYLISSQYKLQIVELNMGNTINTICTNGSFIINVLNKDWSNIEKLINDYLDQIKYEYINIEKNLKWTIFKIKAQRPIITPSSKNIINVLNSLYIGIFMRDEINDINISSNNVGIINTNNNKLEIKTMARSLYPHRYLTISNYIKSAISNLKGTKITMEAILPAWINEKPDKPLANLFNQSVKKIYGNSKKLLPTSGFLETNILMKKCKNFKEALSFGCIVESVHSIKERINLKSLKKFLMVMSDFIGNKKLK